MAAILRSGRPAIRLLVSAILLNLICVCAATKEGGTCILSSSCDAGLHCETCIANGNWRPRCTRIQPLNPTANGRTAVLVRKSAATATSTSSSLLPTSSGPISKP